MPRATRCRRPSSFASDDAGIPFRPSVATRAVGHPADPPTVEEIVAVILQAGNGGAWLVSVGFNHGGCDRCRPHTRRTES
jgi:hypothetical protein